MGQSSCWATFQKTDSVGIKATIMHACWLFWAVFGTVIVLAFLPKQLEDRDFFSKALGTIGTVTGVNASRDVEDGMEWRYNVEFIDYRTGKLITATTSWQEFSGMHACLPANSHEAA
jgi:hypothetical protein